MRRNFWRLVALGVMVPTLVPTLVDAQGRQNPPERGGARARQLGEAVTEVLQLTDQQRPKFTEVNRRFNQREAALNEEERTARLSLRNLLCSGDTTRGSDMSKAIDQVLDIQKRRHQLIEDQQRELATILTPYQRARFLGAREFLRDRLGPGGRGRGMGGQPPGQRGARGGPPPEGRGGQRGGPPPDMCSGPR